MSAKKPHSEKVSNIAPFGLRMLPELKERIQTAADANSRSMNAEIISRLEQSFTASGADGFEEKYKDALKELDRASKAHKEREKYLLEKELYWYNIATSLDGIRRAQAIQFRSTLEHFLIFASHLPDAIVKFCKQSIESLSRQIHDMPTRDEAKQFLEEQANRAHELVYAAPDGEDDPDFIVDPPHKVD